MAAGHGGWRTLQTLHTLPVLIIQPVSRDWYWRQVGRRRIIAWDGCHGALLGVGSLLGQPLVSIYSASLMADALALVGTAKNGASTRASDEAMDKTARILVRKAIISNYLGALTPWYVDVDS